MRSELVLARDFVESHVENGDEEGSSPERDSTHRVSETQHMNAAQSEPDSSDRKASHHRRHHAIDHGFRVFPHPPLQPIPISHISSLLCLSPMPRMLKVLAQ